MGACGSKKAPEQPAMVAPTNAAHEEGPTLLRGTSREGQAQLSSAATDVKGAEKPGPDAKVASRVQEPSPVARVEDDQSPQLAFLEEASPEAFVARPMQPLASPEDPCDLAVLRAAADDYPVVYDYPETENFTAMAEEPVASERFDVGCDASKDAELRPTVAEESSLRSPQALKVKVASRAVEEDSSSKELASIEFLTIPQEEPVECSQRLTLQQLDRTPSDKEVSPVASPVADERCPKDWLSCC